MNDVTRVPYGGAADGDDALRLSDLWHALLDRRWTVFGVAIGFTVLVAVFTLLQDPEYRSETSLRINASGTTSPLDQQLGGGLIGRGDRIQTEMAVLRSRLLASTVVDALGLTVAMEAPDRPRSEVLRVIEAEEVRPALVALKRTEEEGYRVEVREGAVGEAPDLVEIGRPFRLGGVILALQPRLTTNPPEEIVLRLRPQRAAADRLRSGLSVYRPDQYAELVHLQYVSDDPRLAAEVPNQLAQAFIDYKASTSQTEARGAVRFLQDQVETYAGELRAAEEQLRSFREEQQVVSLSDEASQQVTRLAELQAERDRLLTERQSLGALLESVEAGERSGGISPYRQLASFPVFLSNPAVTDILRSLTATEDERTRLLGQRTEQNVDVRRLDTRIRELELQLYQLARNYLQTLDSRIRSAEVSLQRFQGQLEEIPAREIEFARLSRQQGIIEDLYRLLQTRLKEAEIRAAVPAADVQVVDMALVPTSPIAPKPVRNLVIGAVLGLMAGIAIALLRKALDTKVRTQQDVTRATGAVAVLATIPHVPLGSVNGNAKRSPQIATMLQWENGNAAAGGRGKARAAIEAYKALRTNITFAGAGTPPQVLVITSSMPGEGKSTTGVNLAMTLAQQGGRVLLVDADMRRGTLHSLLDLELEPGLAHILAGKTTVADALREVAVREGRPLHVLTTGAFPPDPAEQLGSERMRELLRSLRAEYDTILFDTPPLNLVTDAAVLSQHADATLLVARAGTTDRRWLEHATGQLRHVDARIGGVVLNGVRPQAGGYYGYEYGYTSEES